MGDRLAFALRVMDAAWFIEIAVWAASWMLLCCGWRRASRAPVRLAGELVFLALAIAAGQTAILIFVGSAPYLLLQIVLQGTIGALLLYFRSDCHRKAQAVMWCSMLAGGFALNSIGGQCSFLVGQFLSKGFAEGAVRCAVSLLTVPLALYLHSFSFEECEQVPVSGLTAILTGDVSIIAMNVLEVFWASATRSHTNTIPQRIELCGR